MDYQRVLAELTEWGRADDRLRGLVLTGSGAAGTAHPLSDRDIEVFTTTPDQLIGDESWWDRLGDVLVVERLLGPDGHPTRLVYFVGGKLDLTVLPADRMSGRSYDRPYEVLLDKDGLARSMEQRSPALSLPTECELDESVNWAYAAALMCAKALVRGELWSAKFRDIDLKAQLLAVIEWDHRARYGTDVDTRYLATRMNEWMDAEVRERLAGCWGRLDEQDSVAALRNTLDLYAVTATRIAARLGFPLFAHERVRVEVEEILAGAARHPRVASEGHS